MIFVGEAPTAHATRGPLSGRSGARLARLAGLTLDEWLDRTTRFNLFDEAPDEWNRDDAERCAQAILAVHPDDLVVALGRRVSRAFGAPRKAEWLEPVEIGDDRRVIPLPHPSGRSLYYNDPERRERVGAFLREALDVPSAP